MRDIVGKTREREVIKTERLVRKRQLRERHKEVGLGSGRRAERGRHVSAIRKRLLRDRERCGGGRCLKEMNRGERQLG